MAITIKDDTIYNSIDYGSWKMDLSWGMRQATQKARLQELRARVTSSGQSFLCLWPCACTPTHSTDGKEMRLHRDRDCVCPDCCCSSVEVRASFKEEEGKEATEQRSDKVE